jgi:hypothetical protein
MEVDYTWEDRYGRKRRAIFHSIYENADDSLGALSSWFDGQESKGKFIVRVHRVMDKIPRRKRRRRNK